MQSIASLMSIGRVSDIGDMGELDEEEEEEDTASRISEMTSKFYTSVTEEDDSAAALGLTNGATSDYSESHLMTSVLCTLCKDINLKQTYFTKCYFFYSLGSVHNL